MKKICLIILTVFALSACKQGGTSRLTRQEMRDKLAYRSASSLGQDRANGSSTNNLADNSFEDENTDDITDDINYDQKVYTIMAGSFSAKESADQILIRANKVGYDGKVTMNSENNFVVHLAHSNDRDKVKEALEDLQERNIIPPDAFITVEK